MPESDDDLIEVANIPGRPLPGYFSWSLDAFTRGVELGISYFYDVLWTPPAKMIFCDQSFADLIANPESLSDRYTFAAKAVAYADRLEQRSNLKAATQYARLCAATRLFLKDGPYPAVFEDYLLEQADQIRYWRIHGNQENLWKMGRAWRQDWNPAYVGGGG